MHLVGFIIRIYHDARSSECQIRCRVLQRVTATLVKDFDIALGLTVWLSYLGHKGTVTRPSEKYIATFTMD